jgi:hypothetical protein
MWKEPVEIVVRSVRTLFAVAEETTMEELLERAELESWIPREKFTLRDGMGQEIAE